MVKKLITLLLILSLLLTACAAQEQADTAVPASQDSVPAAAQEEQPKEAAEEEPAAVQPARIAEAPERIDAVIVLSDNGITVDGAPISADAESGIYAARDIVYYPTGKDLSFGEGEAADAHEAAEADGHTVIHITEPGAYEISGSLSAGQIAVDLGADAKDDPAAVVTLLLNGADITCTVAPAVIFYRVYECGDKENPSPTVDTSTAGANVFLADGSRNTVTGSYVARIYKPESVVLSEDGREVLDAEKLHKYDGALYSRMSMNVDGNDGILHIFAENEGLDSELHLTVNGGDIRIESGNDGINTNEDGISVTTVNGGRLSILVNGSTGEGDGIDSNGWIVVNGGYITAEACAFSGDAGIDSDLGILLNGGSVIASGSMLDPIEGGSMNYAVFTFAERQTGGIGYTLRSEDGGTVMEAAPDNGFSILLLASEAIREGSYALLREELPLSVAAAQGGGMGMPGGMMPQGGMTPPEGMEMPEGMEQFEGMTPPEGMEMPEGMTPPEGMETPEGMTPPEGMETPEGAEPPHRGSGAKGADGFAPTEGAAVFEIRSGGNSFTVLS